MATDAVRHLARSMRESQNKPQINPSVLVVVIILSVVIFCSGILHILARCVGRRRTREPADGVRSPSVSARGQLQHLFSLHDSGVEQVFIDALPVFLYGSIRGLKDSADCAVCLNEFQNEDKLRLLPKCKHAFHFECIDTWLFSNSTCPLCRRSLLPEAEPIVPASNSTSCAAAAVVAIVPNEEEGGPAQQQPSHGSFRESFGRSIRASVRGSFRFLTDVVASSPPPPPPPPLLLPSEREPALILQNPSPPIDLPTPPMTPGPTVCVTEADGSEKTLRVELGKVNCFISRRAPDHDVGSSRMARSYSMGSYEYVVDFASLGLRTPFPEHNHSQGKSPSKPTHRNALSDSVPELANASHTPGLQDLFWASRGFETPHNLSRVREIMTPTPGWLSSPMQRVHISHGKEHRGEIEVAKAADEHVVEISAENQVLQGEVEAPLLSLRLLNSLEGTLKTYSLRYSTGDLEMEDSVAAAERQDKLWEMLVDVPDPIDANDTSSSLKKSSSFGWLRGRSKRSLVYSAASPSSTNMQSTEARIT